jgi:serine/threonine-protein kinase
VTESRVGNVLASKYRLEELLGSGGMAYVYRAVNEHVGRTVAIKVLRPECAANASIVERFLREARVANIVRHPNVVDVLDIGLDGDGTPFIVQELLTGQNLAQYVENRGGRLTLAEVEKYLLPVIDAIGEAHARGVVHRDIKPDNVFLAEQGQRLVPKLLDFGISKIRLPNVRMTEVGTIMGTPAYMAPEQLNGSGEVDPRTDVWALGVTLFELLSGTLPFNAPDAPALFVAIATKEAPRLIDVCPDVGPEVSRICERCLRRAPDDRYPTALELARDIRHVLEGSAIEPTGKHSIPPALEKVEVPDLVLPPPKAPTMGKMPAVATAREKTELTTAHGSPAPLSAHAGAPSSIAQPPSLDVRPRAIAPPAPIAPAPAPEAARSTPAVAGGGPLPGVMLGPTASPAPHRRPAPIALELDARMPPQAEAGPDMSFVVGLAVIGLSLIGTTALLMTFARQPEGIHVVSMVTTPTPTSNLVVHGGLGLVGLVLTARCVMAGMKRWRELGGRGGAVISAMLGGAFFFAAIELARAAW